MSLRLRLLIGVVVVSFVGLLVADVVTLGLVRIVVADRASTTGWWPCPIRPSTGCSTPACGPTTRTPRTNRFGRASGYFAEIQGPDGQPLDRTEPAPTANPVPLPDLPVVPTSSPLPRRHRSPSARSATPSFEWRVRAVPVGDTGSTLVVALPLTDVQDTIRTLLLIEAIATAGCAGRHLRPRAGGSSTSGSDPLRTDGGDRGEHRRRRPLPAGRAGRRQDRDRPARHGAQLDAHPDRGRHRPARGVRAAPAPVRRRRQPRAAHAGHGHPRLRRALRAGAADRRRPAPGHGPHQERVAAHVEAHRGPAAAGPPRPPGAGPPPARRPGRAGRGGRRRRPRHRARPTALVHVRRARRCTVLGDQDQLHQVVANLLANVRDHTPAGTPAGVEVRTDGGTAVRVTVFDCGPGHPAPSSARSVRAVPPGRPLAHPGPQAAPGSAWPSWPPSSGPTAARFQASRRSDRRSSSSPGAGLAQSTEVPPPSSSPSAAARTTGRARAVTHLATGSSSRRDPPAPSSR